MATCAAHQVGWLLLETCHWRSSQCASCMIDMEWQCFTLLSSAFNEGTLARKWRLAS